MKDRLSANSLSQINEKRQSVLDRITKGSSLKDRVKDFFTGEKTEVYQSKFSQNHIIFTRDDAFVADRDFRPIRNHNSRLGSGDRYEDV